MFVVCDANGICRGVFANEEFAFKVADYYAAYVSKHTEINTLSTEEDFKEFVQNNFKEFVK